ncbi:MAG: alpha/beta hydrolase, partial [Algoriphagus sp.]
NDVEIGRNTRIEAQMISTSSLKQAFYIGSVFDVSRSNYKFLSNSLDEIKNATQTFFGPRFKYYRNSQNDRNFPTRGAEALLDATLHVKDWIGVNLQAGVDSVVFDSAGESSVVSKEYLDSYVESLVPNSYMSLYAKYSKFFGLGPKVQFHPDFAAGLTLSSEDPTKIFTEFFVGGYQNIRFNDTRFWGLNYAEVQTPNFIKLGAEFQYNPVNKIYLRVGANFLGLSDQVPFSDFDFFNEIYQNTSYLGYGVDISFQTIFGPISAGIGGNSKDNALRSYLSIGFSFNYSDR